MSTRRPCQKDGRDWRSCLHRLLGINRMRIRRGKERRGRGERRTRGSRSRRRGEGWQPVPSSRGAHWFCDYARAISFRSLKAFSMCSKHSRRSWRRVARPASAESNPSDLAAAAALQFGNAPQMRRVRWRRCSSTGAYAAMGNKETGSAPSSSQLLTRSQPLVQRGGGQQAEDGAAEFRPEGNPARPLPDSQPDGTG